MNLAVVVRDVDCHDDVHALRLSLALAQTPRAHRVVHGADDTWQLLRGYVVGRPRVQTHPHVGEVHHVLLAHAQLRRLRVVLEVVQDDRDDQVEHDKRAEDAKEAEEYDGADRVRRALIGVRVLVQVLPEGIFLVVVSHVTGSRILVIHAILRDHAVVHDAVPSLARRHAEQREHREPERLEVGVPVEEVAGDPNLTEQVHPQHGEDEEEQKQNRADVGQSRKRIEQRLEQLLQPLSLGNQPEDPRHAKHADDAQVRRRDVRGQGDGDAHDGQRHHEEIKRVPRISKVSAGLERDELHDRLDAEDRREPAVDQEQTLLEVLRHVRVGHGHDHDVDHDQRQDERLEPAAGDDVVDEVAHAIQRPVRRLLQPNSHQQPLNGHP